MRKEYSYVIKRGKLYFGKSCKWTSKITEACFYSDETVRNLIDNVASFKDCNIAQIIFLEM